jgi:glycosyltransferase involved in cell wall biosynthesis
VGLTPGVARMLRASVARDGVCPGAAEVAASLPPPELEGLARAAVFHGVAGYVHLATEGLDGIPEVERRILADSRKLAALNHLRTVAALRSLGRDLRAAGVPWLVIKGPALAGPVHGSPELRWHGDLDVVVPAERLGEAVAVLEGSGAQMMDRNWTLIRSHLKGEVHLRLALDVALDLHWHLLNDRSLREAFPLSMAGVFDRSRVIRIAGMDVPTLSGADTVVHVALHLMLAGGHRLIWLKDLERLLATGTAPVAEVARRAREWQAEVVLAAALGRVARALGCPPGARPLLEPRTPHRLWTGVDGLAARLTPVERQDGSASLLRILARSARGSERQSGVELARKSLHHLTEARREGPRLRLAEDDPANPGSDRYDAGGDVERTAFMADVARHASSPPGRTDRRPGPGSWDVVLVGGVTLDGMRSLGDWHLARALAREHRVLYVDPPLFPRSLVRERDLRALRPRPRDVGAQLRAVRPVATPGSNRPWGARVGDRVIAGQVRRLLGDDASRPRVVIVFDPRRGDLPSVPRDLLVYWRRDRLARSQTAAQAEHIQRRDRALMTRADLVTGVSQPPTDEACACGADAVLVPNGCDVAHFSIPRPRPPDFPRRPGPIVGFAGGVSWRVDAELLVALARSRPDWTFLLVGEITHPLPELTNLCCVGPVPFDELPAWVQRFDVGIVPYATNPFNQAADPLKVYEYLAAGIPVVSTALPAVLGLDPFVRTASGVEDFALAIKSALCEPPDPARLRRMAQEHDWRVRAELLDRHIADRLRGPMRPGLNAVLQRPPDEPPSTEERVRSPR